MMRGIDYRSKGAGICLIANKSFTSYRALAQGMSRVGRFNDQCERVFVENVKEVDLANIKKTNAAIAMFINSLKASQVEDAPKVKKAQKDEENFKKPAPPKEGTRMTARQTELLFPKK